MKKNEDSESFNGLKNFTQFLCLLILFVDAYFFGLEFYIKYLNHKLLLNIILSVEKTGILKSAVYPKIAITLLCLCFIITDKGKKKEGLDKNVVITNTILSTILFILSGLLPKFFNAPILYSLSIILGFIYLIKSYTMVGKLLNIDMMGDRFNKRNKIFPQMSKEVTTKLSVNVPYNFVTSYKKKGEDLIPIYEKGFINVVAPNRASLILGKPGSGKSYAFIEEFIKQHIQKAFAMIVYDYKFPTLTNICYDYFENNKSKYSIYSNGARFATINLDDPRYSNRCNPIRSDLLTTKPEAVDAVYTIFFNIDKKSAQKQDFFSMSAMAITSAALWFLRIYKEGKYCSLPHLIQFLMHPDDQILRILDSYDELQYFTAAFSDALHKKAFEQLTGQTASARIPLGKISTDEMFYVMTDPDHTGVNLAVNKKEEVTILNVANNPKTQKTNAPAMGLYMSQAAKLINAQKRVPCNFLIDELPTIYVNGINELIATGRSNEVCVTLACQDYSQLVMDYGKEIADSIFNTIGNIFSGQVAIDTSKKISESIGKLDYKMQSRTINDDDGGNIQLSSQREYTVPPEDFNQFTQGEFAGIVSDTYKSPLEHKVFRGMVSPDKSDQTGKEFPMVNPDLTQEDLTKNAQRVRDEIKEIIKDEMERLDNLENEKLTEQYEQEQNPNQQEQAMSREDIANLNPYDNGEIEPATIHNIDPDDINIPEEFEYDESPEELIESEDPISKFRQNTDSLNAVKNVFSQYKKEKSSNNSDNDPEEKPKPLIDYKALKNKHKQTTLNFDNQEEE